MKYPKTVFLTISLVLISTLTTYSNVKVHDVQGSVHRSPDFDHPGEPIGDKATLDQGVVMYTNSGSSAGLEFSDGSEVSVKQYSTLKLAQLNASPIKLELRHGVIHVRVGVSSLEVEVFGRRIIASGGSRFRVSLLFDETRQRFVLSVTKQSGEVAFQDVRDDSGRLPKLRQLREGQMGSYFIEIGDAVASIFRYIEPPGHLGLLPPPAETPEDSGVLVVSPEGEF